MKEPHLSIPRHCALAATGVVKRKFGCSHVRDLKVVVSDGAKRDIGEAEGSAPHVRIAAPVIGSQSKGRLGRKGTGFVQLGELPTSDDDDEDDDEETPRGGSWGTRAKKRFVCVFGRT